MPTLTVKIHDSAMERLKAEAAMHQTTLSGWVRHKLGIARQEVIDESDGRADDVERRLSRLEQMAGL
jgi:hypothetical protein